MTTIDLDTLNRMKTEPTVPFRRHVRLAAEIEEMVESSWDEVVEPFLETKVGRRRRWREKFRFYRDFILCLYLAGLRGQGVGYDRGWHKYRPGTRNRKLHLHYSDVMAVANALREIGWTEKIAGKRSSDSRFWQRSGDRLTLQGMTALLDRLPEKSIPVALSQSARVIKLKDGDGDQTEYRRTPAAARLREFVKDWNEFIGNFHITWEVEVGQLAQLNEKQLRTLTSWIPELSIELRLYHSSWLEDRLGNSFEDTKEPGLYKTGKTLEKLHNRNSVTYSLCGNSCMLKQSLETAFSVSELSKWLSGQSGNTDMLCIRLPGTVYRVFKLGASSRRNDPASWLNGRYVGEHQVIPEDWRSAISVNGRRLVELDFEAMFPRLACHLNGVEVREEFYDLYPELGSLKNRKLAKRWFLIRFGSASWEKSREPIQETINLDRDVHRFMRDRGLTARDVMATMDELHPDLVPFFDNGYGLMLMRMESEICTEVMKIFLDKGVPLLSVHDSFLSPEPGLLRDAMDHAYQEVSGGFSCPIH